MADGPNNFDEANAATQELFHEEQVELPTEEDQVEEPAPEAEEEQEIPQETEETIENAVQTAEVAAETAAQKDEQLRQVLSEIESLKQQNAQLQGTIEEMSKQNAENIVEEALQPPTLDLSNLAFASDEEQQAAMAKYAEDMAAYNRQELMKELAPTLKYAEKGMHEQEANEAITLLSQVPELSGIENMKPNLDRIIASNAWLQSDDMPLDEKYINAYAIARGIDSIKNPPKAPETPKEPTTDELMELYRKNPDLQALIEKERLEAVKSGQQVPPLSASSGAAGAALDIKEKPQTIEEAAERTRKLFGLS